MHRFFSIGLYHLDLEMILEGFLILLQTFVKPTRESIVCNFENFGALVWGPLFELSAFDEAIKVLRPLLQNIIGMVDKIDDSQSILTLTFNLFLVV